MGSKYKMTGCAKFFFVLIILAPLAYLGASYYNGQDGIQNIKNLLGMGSEQARGPSGDEATTDLQEQIEKLQRDVKYFESEAERLKEELEACQQARN